jgi:hypothetical protein
MTWVILPMGLFDVVAALAADAALGAAAFGAAAAFAGALVVAFAMVLSDPWMIKRQ